MNKYKILVGMCGPEIIYTSVISAHDEKEAVVKYLNSIGEEPSEERINEMLRFVREHVPKPRKKR